MGQDIKDGYQNFISTLIPFGVNSMEVSVLSEIESPVANFVSKAHVEIRRIHFLGTEHGGATDCYAAPLGWYAPEKSELALQC